MGRVVRSLFVAAVLAVLLAVPVWAQSAPEVIHDYTVEIQILSDGDLSITETIDYDFGSELHHGIFRTIPTRFPYDDTHERVFPIEDVSVESCDGAGRRRGLRGRWGHDDPRRRSRSGDHRPPTPTSSGIGSRAR